MLTKYAVYDTVTPDALESDDIIRYLGEVFIVVRIDDPGTDMVIVYHLDDMGDDSGDYLLIPYWDTVDLLREVDND